MKTGFCTVVVIPLTIMTCFLLGVCADCHASISMRGNTPLSERPVASSAGASSWSLHHKGESYADSNRISGQPSVIHPVAYRTIGSSDGSTSGHEEIRLANRFSPGLAVIGSDPLGDVLYESASGRSIAMPTGGRIIAIRPTGPRQVAACGPIQPPTRCASNGYGLGSMFRQMWADIRSDYRNYYSYKTLYDISIAVAIAAPFANTQADASFGNWYQEDVRSAGTDNFAVFTKTFGEGEYVIPISLGVWLLCEYFNQVPTFDVLGEWGGRTARGYLVGAAPMLFMQYMLGGGRPGEHSVGSQWRPFQDSNAVSGHAFMGAVPFITAAKMTDQPLLKGVFYVCSTFTAWSRVNDNDHYLTQICLGWWMAYVASQNVEKTEIAKYASDWSMEMQPLLTPGMSGIGVIITH